MTLTDVNFATIPGVGGDIGKIILNRPQNLNALNLSMCVAIRGQLQQWAQLQSIKAVIIAGQGDRAFCAGGDVRSIYADLKQGHFEEAIHFFQQEYAMNQAIFSFPKPYIAFLDGITMGGGVGVSIHGSHVIATERLTWAMPETRIGFFPDVGSGYHLARLPHHIGDYLALTGERLTANDAYQIGLVKAVIPAQRLAELENALLTTPFNSFDMNAVTQIIARVHQPVANSTIEFKLIKEHFSRSSVEEIMNSLQHDNDPWCQATATTLLTLSPLSLKITFEHLRHCAQFNFQQAIAEDMQLAKKFVKNPDFLEGVRAALIDKDHDPHWQPSGLTKVTMEILHKYFSVV